MSRKKPLEPETTQQVTSTSDVALEASSVPRPIRLEWVRAGSLSDNPENWKTHGLEQRHTLSDQMDRVGWAGALLFNERTGRLLDGHLRKALADPEAEVPVLIGSWTEEQERTILATLDPIASMAVGQAAQFDALRESIDADSRWLRDLLDTIAAGIERTEDTASGAGDDALLPEMERHAFEHHDYLVLMFKHDQDFQQACELLGVRNVEVTYPKGLTKVGLGRVVDGPTAVSKLRSAGAP